MPGLILTHSVNKLFDETIRPNLNRLVDGLLEQDRYEDVKRLAGLTKNPIEFAKIREGEDGWLDKETFIRVLYHLPVDIEINEKPPHESPIAVELCHSGILQVCPFDKEGEVTQVCRKGYGIHVPGIIRYTKMDFGVPSLHLDYNPALTGVEGYRIQKKFQNKDSLHDKTLSLEIRLLYYPQIFD